VYKGVSCCCTHLFCCMMFIWLSWSIQGWWCCGVVSMFCISVSFAVMLDSSKRRLLISCSFAKLLTGLLCCCVLDGRSPSRETGCAVKLSALFRR
jgi:hypothetical protein